MEHCTPHLFSKYEIFTFKMCPTLVKHMLMNNDVLYTKQNLRVPTLTTENMRLIREHMTEKSGVLLIKAIDGHPVVSPGMNDNKFPFPLRLSGFLYLLVLLSVVSLFWNISRPVLPQHEVHRRRPSCRRRRRRRGRV